MTRNNGQSPFDDNAERRDYEGTIIVQPGGTVLRAYASAGPVAAIVDPDDPSTFDAADVGNFSLSVYGLRVDGHDCLLSVVASRGEGFDADVVEVDLSPSANLDEVVAFQAQDRQVGLTFEYVAMDTDFGGLCVAGEFTVANRCWSFEGRLMRTLTTSRIPRVTRGATIETPGVLH